MVGIAQVRDRVHLPLLEQWPCREAQIQKLSALLNRHLPSPSTLVAHGPRGTGKSDLIRAYLEAAHLPYAVVQCRECVTSRQLLQRAVARVLQTLAEAARHDGREGDARCEHAGALVLKLQQLLGKPDKFVLVFDGIDQLREPSPTLLPALARFGETMPHLSILLIVQHPPSRFLRQAGVPHIHFPPYPRDEAIRILSSQPLDVFPIPLLPARDYDDEAHAVDKAWLWPRFCAAVWDSLARHAARDIPGFRELCHQLWVPFVTPIVAGEFGTRDFSRLLVKQRRLFQDESTLSPSIVSAPASDPLTQAASKKGSDLPYSAKYVLLAAYLASYTPARFDNTIFTKSSQRKRRKKGVSGGNLRRRSQKRVTARHLLPPTAYSLDRLFAILHAILPHGIRTSIDTYTQIATLSSLRLLVRAGVAGSVDHVEPGGKWRVGAMVGWEYARKLARSVNLDIADYVVD